MQSRRAYWHTGLQASIRVACLRHFVLFELISLCSATDPPVSLVSPHAKLNSLHEIKGSIKLVLLNETLQLVWERIETIQTSH